MHHLNVHFKCCCYIDVPLSEDCYMYNHKYACILMTPLVKTLQGLNKIFH